MPQDEFTETPYAASFGPVPVTYQQAPQQLNVSGLQPPVRPSNGGDQMVPAVQPVQPMQSAQYTTSSRRSNKNNHLPDLESIIMDENMAQSLSAAEQLGNIGLDDTEQWDATINTVMGGLRSLQTKWSTLEAERKRLTRPTNSSTQSQMTRGVRRRGRGRGRRRGRWRAV